MKSAIYQVKIDDVTVSADDKDRLVELSEKRAVRVIKIRRQRRYKKAKRERERMHLAGQTLQDFPDEDFSQYDYSLTDSDVPVSPMVGTVQPIKKR